MIEIQIFDPVAVLRRELDEANAKAKRSDNLLAMALVDWAEDRAKVATERDEARRDVAALRGGQHATWASGYDEGRRHGHKEGEDENVRLRVVADRLDAEVEKLSFDRFTLATENKRLVAQLLQDAPIAAAARSFVAGGIVDAAALLALRCAVLGEPKCIGAAGLGCELPAGHVGPHLNPSYQPPARAR